MVGSYQIAPSLGRTGTKALIPHGLELRKATRLNSVLEERNRESRICSRLQWNLSTRGMQITPVALLMNEQKEALKSRRKS